MITGPKWLAVLCRDTQSTRGVLLLGGRARKGRSRSAGSHLPDTHSPALLLTWQPGGRGGHSPIGLAWQE